MLEAIGTAADGKEDKVYRYVREAFKADPVNWKPQRANLAWRLHPANAIEELKSQGRISPSIRAGASESIDSALVLSRTKKPQKQ